MATRVGVCVGVCVGLLAMLFAGWLCGASGRWELDRALRAAELHNDLLEARASVTGARVSLCEADVSQMIRQLEDARRFVARARARSGFPGVSDGPLRLDLAGLGAEIDEAQRLVAGLPPGQPAAAPACYAAMSGEPNLKP